MVELSVKGFDRVDQVPCPMVRWCVIGIESGKVVDYCVDSAKSVDEGIVVLDVNMSGGVVV